MIKKIIGLGFILSCMGVSAYAEELNLVCVHMTPAQMQVRHVIAGRGHQNQMLESSYGKKVGFYDGQPYAVVIELVPGEGRQPAFERWDVLNGSEFSIKKIDNFHWQFVQHNANDVVSYQCEINRTVHANPAVTRNN